MKKLLEEWLGVETMRRSLNAAIVANQLLQQRYDEILAAYVGLRDSKREPAPDDANPWQARFVELEHEFDAYRRDHERGIRENWTSSANFREAKMHYREFLKYMERE